MANLTDQERAKLATYSRPRWYGPIEHQECSRHFGCYESFRWVWRGEREDIQDGHTELVQDCSECARECPEETRP